MVPLRSGDAGVELGVILNFQTELLHLSTRYPVAVPSTEYDLYPVLRGGYLTYSRGDYSFGFHQAGV